MQPRTARSPRSIEEIKADLEATKDIVRKNLNKALERGEKLKKLSNQTKQLYDEAPLFSRESDRLANWKRYQKNLWSTVLFGATLGILYGLVQGFAWQLLLISAVIGGDNVLFIDQSLVFLSRFCEKLFLIASFR